MKSLRLAFLSTPLLALPFAAAAAPPGAVRAAQVAAVGNPAGVAAEAEKLEALGYSPVWTHQSGDMTLLLVGKCERYVDAYLLRESLRENGYPDAFEKSFSDLVTGDFDTDAAMPEEPLVFPAAGDARAGELLFRTVTYTNDKRVRDITAALRGGPDEAAIADARSLMNALSNNDPLKGYLAIDLGKAIVGSTLNINSETGENMVASAEPMLPAMPPVVESDLHRQKIEESLELFLQVARGEVAATADDRLAARWLAADTLHYHLNDFIRAYQAYDEIYDYYCGIKRNASENSTPIKKAHEPGSDISVGTPWEAIRARALVEINACLLELAQSAKGDFDEVRRASRQILETVPPEYDRARAVADLIWCESYLYEGKASGDAAKQRALKEKSLAEFAGFEQRHPGRVREISMANHMQGWLLAELDRWEEVVLHFERNLSLDLSDPREGFYWRGERWNMARLSAKWLMKYAQTHDDKARQEQYAGYLDVEAWRDAQTPIDPATFDVAFPHGWYLETRAGAAMP